MSYKVVRLAHAGKRNRYLAATGIAFIGYVLFLSSALWFPGQKKSMEYTPLGIQQEIGETTCMVSVVYWAYAPEQEAMLVELDLDGIRSEVTFSAVDKARDPIPVEVKLAQSGTYVLKLSSVPEDFQAISLRVMVEGQTRRLYTNIDQVEQVNRLHFYPDLTGYYNDSAQKTPAVRKNVRGMNAPITNNATIIPTGFSSGIVGFSWPDVLQNAVIRCIALLFQEKHFR